MLDFFLILGSSYLFYTWGVRNMFKAKLFKREIYDWFAYAFFMIVGLTISLSVSITTILPLQPNGSVWEKSVIPTLLAIAIGEILYARNARLAMRMLNRGESDENDGQ
jgi:hypothetical protein